MGRLSRLSGGSGSIVIDTIGPTLDIMAATLATRITTAMEEGAEEIEAYGQANAPWDDRTGAARDGLTAEVDFEDGEVVITFYHSVDYGLWLELIQDGRFAIIMPTLEYLGPQIIERAAGEVTSTL
jgi:hypothetical protein